MISISTILVCRATNRLSEMNVSLPTVRMCLSDSLSQDTVLLFRLYTCSQSQSQQMDTNKLVLKVGRDKGKKYFAVDIIKKEKCCSTFCIILYIYLELSSYLVRILFF